MISRPKQGALRLQISVDMDYLISCFRLHLKFGSLLPCSIHFIFALPFSQTYYFSDAYIFLKWFSSNDELLFTPEGKMFSLVAVQ